MSILQALAKSKAPKADADERPVLPNGLLPIADTVLICALRRLGVREDLITEILTEEPVESRGDWIEYYERIK